MPSRSTSPLLSNFVFISLFNSPLIPVCAVLYWDGAIQWSFPGTLLGTSPLRLGSCPETILSAVTQLLRLLPFMLEHGLAWSCVHLVQTSTADSWVQWSCQVRGYIALVCSSQPLCLRVFLPSSSWIVHGPWKEEIRYRCTVVASILQTLVLYSFLLAVIICVNLCSCLEVPLMKPEGYTSLWT